MAQRGLETTSLRQETALEVGNCITSIHSTEMILPFFKADKGEICSLYQPPITRGKISWRDFSRKHALKSLAINFWLADKTLAWPLLSS